MIAKVGSSTSIVGTAHYLEHNADRVEWKEAHNLASQDTTFVINQMKQTANDSKTNQPIYHYSLSWDDRDNPTKKQMLTSAKQTLRDLGMSEHQALIVAHNDHDYKHVHVMVNRVHPVSSNAWNRWMDYQTLEKSLRSLERSYGWREVPGHHGRLNDQAKPKYGQTLNRADARQVNDGRSPFFMVVRRHATSDFREATSWETLQQNLAAKGLTIQRGSRGTGGKITDGHEYANLSKIHRDFSMNKLEKRLGPFHSLDHIRQHKYPSQAISQFSGLDKTIRLNQPAKTNTFKKD